MSCLLVFDSRVPGGPVTTMVRLEYPGRIERGPSRPHQAGALGDGVAGGEDPLLDLLWSLAETHHRAGPSPALQRAITRDPTRGVFAASIFASPERVTPWRQVLL